MKKLIVLVSTLLISSVSMAQNAYDLFQYSNTSARTSSTTAKVAAMGGAFTSLGADISSASINPAGLGLYKSSDIALTPNLSFSAVTTKSEGNSVKDRVSDFNLSNLSAMFNLVTSETKLVRGLTIGFGYNLDASQNYNGKANSSASQWSIIDHYANQLTGSNVNPNDIFVSSENPFGAYQISDPSLWGAIDAFNNGTMENTSDAPYSYRPDQRSFIEGDRFSSVKTTQYQTRTENFSFSMGIKLGNYVNLGMALGVTDYTSSQRDVYSEYASNTNLGDYNGLDQWEARSLQGSAFDFKVGAIVEPLAGLRVGVAYHAPRVSTIYDSYYIDQEVFYTDNTSYYTQSAIYETWYKMKSPSKLLTGISYVIGGVGIISFDWERAYYNKMSISGIDYGSGYSPNDEVKDSYQAQDIFRVGAEVYIGYGLFVRGGFVQSTSPLKSTALADPKYDESFRNISAGFGWTNGNFYVDFAYVNSKVNHQPYYLYSADFSPIAAASQKDNFYSITAGIRF